jgi:hypothetical protein
MSEELTEPPARACPMCGRWLKSGKHRGSCPGRKRRRRRRYGAATILAGGCRGKCLGCVGDA